MTQYKPQSELSGSFRVIPAEAAPAVARFARDEFLKRLKPYGLTVLEDVQKKWWKT